MRKWYKLHKRQVFALNISLGLFSFFVGLGWGGIMPPIAVSLIAGFIGFITLVIIAAILADEPPGSHSSIYPDH